MRCGNGKTLAANQTATSCSTDCTEQTGCSYEQSDRNAPCVGDGLDQLRCTVHSGGYYLDDGLVEACLPQGDKCKTPRANVKCLNWPMVFSNGTGAVVYGRHWLKCEAAVTGYQVLSDVSGLVVKTCRTEIASCSDLDYSPEMIQCHESYTRAGNSAKPYQRCGIVRADNGSYSCAAVSSYEDVPHLTNVNNTIDGWPWVSCANSANSDNSNSANSANSNSANSANSNSDSSAVSGRRALRSSTQDGTSVPTAGFVQGQSAAGMALGIRARNH
eukprot:COSAG05_NODE_3295_length_2170_cov_4991.631579_2_plen_273_part_00